MNCDLTQFVTPSAADDADLVLASKAGDRAAFEELIARYDRKLFRIAYHIVHDPDDAQDVVQETFVKVFQNLGQFQAHSKFSTWLYRIAVNQSLMELGSSARNLLRQPSCPWMATKKQASFRWTYPIGDRTPKNNTKGQSCENCSPEFCWNCDRRCE